MLYMHPSQDDWASLYYDMLASFILLTLESGEGLHLILPHRNTKKDLLKFSLCHHSQEKCTVMRAENHIHNCARPDTPIGTISKPCKHTVQIILAPRRSSVL